MLPDEGNSRIFKEKTEILKLQNFQTKTKFIRISPASLTESHTHDVLVTREAPNYPVRG